MTKGIGTTLGLAATLIFAIATHASAAGPKAAGAAGAKKKVLVELYTSQGCSSCPPASQFLATLAERGYGPDRVVPLGFHVDYFNDPWADPYSDPEFSRRQGEYNEVLRRRDLYYTPMMMVDGRVPMVGSDRPRALAAIERSLKEPPGVRLGVAMMGAGRARELVVDLSDPAAGVEPRDLIVCAAVVEDSIATNVASGENGGRTLVEPSVVRRFARRPARLDKAPSARLTFPLELRPGQEPGKTRVAVFVQDRASGVVYQAESIRWGKIAR